MLRYFVVVQVLVKEVIDVIQKVIMVDLIRFFVEQKSEDAGVEVEKLQDLDYFVLVLLEIIDVMDLEFVRVKLVALVDVDLFFLSPPNQLLIHQGLPKVLLKRLLHLADIGLHQLRF